MTREEVVDSTESGSLERSVMRIKEVGGYSQVSWPRIALGFVVTGVVALGVHVVLLEWCKVPYPAQLPRAGIVPFLNYAASVLATFVFYGLAAPQVATLRTWQKCLGLSLLLVMLNEVFRVAFIEGVVTTAWRYSLVSNLHNAVMPFLLGLLVALSAPRLTRWWQRVLAALVIAGVLFLGARPLVDAAFKSMLEAMAGLSHEQIYSDTSWQLNVAAFIGYIEPAVASFVMAALAWPRLSVHPARRALQFALLLMLVRRTFFMAFYYPFFAPLPAPLAMLSAGQFTLEWFTLGLLTVVTLQLGRKRTVNHV